MSDQNGRQLTHRRKAFYGIVSSNSAQRLIKNNSPSAVNVVRRNMLVFLRVWLADKREPSIVSSTFNTPITQVLIQIQDTT